MRMRLLYQLVSLRFDMAGMTRTVPIYSRNKRNVLREYSTE